MTGLGFDPKINFGNLMVAGGLLVAAVTSYTFIQSDIKANRTEIERHAERMTSNEASMREAMVERTAWRLQSEVRTRALEISQAGVGSDISNIRLGIQDIKQTLEKYLDNGALK